MKILVFLALVAIAASTPVSFYKSCGERFVHLRILEEEMIFDAKSR